MSRLFLQAAQVAERDMQLFDGIPNSVQPIPGQPLTYDPIRLGLVIRNFITAISAPAGDELGTSAGGRTLHMTPKTTSALDGLPLRTVKASLRSSEGRCAQCEAEAVASEAARQKETPDGALVLHAMKVAGLETKQLAPVMGISESYLLRGFKDLEHISWQRLQIAGRVYPAFMRALIETLAAGKEGVRVITRIEMDRERVG